MNENARNFVCFDIGEGFDQNGLNQNKLTYQKMQL